MKFCFTLSLIFLVSLKQWLFAQPASVNVDSVSALFSNFIQTQEKENIVLQTDRNIYIAGEKIWFKAYVVNEESSKTFNTYKNLFVDLVNEQDSIVDQLVLDNMEHRTNGTLNLPDSIATGFYWVRCYTARQLAGDSENIFIQPVFIQNKKLHDLNIYTTQYNRLYKNDSIKPHVRFFAERLTAIPGIISTGVIEIKDNHLNPLTAKGNLLNSKDSVITEFTTNKFGLGRLTFVYDPKENYTVIFHLGLTDIKYPLPTVDKNAAQISVGKQTSQTIKAFVTLEESLPTDMQTTILAVKGDSLCYAAVGKGNYGITIPIENFPGGIIRLLLFNNDKELLNERKIFIPKENVKAEIKTNKKKYDARENATVYLRLTDSNENPVPASLNIAVEDGWISQFNDSLVANTMPPENELLLDNWLTVNISKYSHEDIDLLLTTIRPAEQKYTEQSNSLISKYDDNTKLLNLNGKITDKKGSALNQQIITVLTKNTGIFFMDVDTTDNNGMFNIAIPQGFDSLKLSLQITDKHNTQKPEDNIQVNGFEFPILATPLNLKQKYRAENFNLISSIHNYHIDTAITFQGKGWLTPVTVTTVKKEEPNYDVSRRINSISQILTSDKISHSYNGVGLALLTVPGVSYAYGDITILGRSLSKPLILMDGVEYPIPAGFGADGPVMNFLNSLSPADIDFIEVLKGGEAAIYGSRGEGGVISINTKHGPDKINYSKTNFKSFTPVTYHTAPKFQMPDYSNKEIKSSAGPDPRTTIYWNGNVTTNANGEAEINFFTADNATNYIVTVTGVTVKGELIYKRITITNSGKIK